jgi:hypothetical protein
LHSVLYLLNSFWQWHSSGTTVVPQWSANWSLKKYFLVRPQHWKASGVWWECVENLHLIVGDEVDTNHQSVWKGYQICNNKPIIIWPLFCSYWMLVIRLIFNSINWYVLLPINFCSFGLGILHFCQWHSHNCVDKSVGCPVLVVDKKNFSPPNEQPPDHDHLCFLVPPSLLPRCNPCKSTSCWVCEVENYASNSKCNGLDLLVPFPFSSWLSCVCGCIGRRGDGAKQKESILWQFCCTSVLKIGKCNEVTLFLAGKYMPSMEDRGGNRWHELFPKRHCGYNFGRMHEKRHHSNAVLVLSRGHHQCFGEILRLSDIDNWGTGCMTLKLLSIGKRLIFQHIMPQIKM